MMSVLPPPPPFESLVLGYGLVFSHSRSFVIFQMSLNPWAGCEGYAECEWALELNGHQVLFECGHRRYWYLGDRVWPQVQHEYPPTTIPIPHCPSIQLADFLADEEITGARDGYIIAGVEGNYSNFIQTHLQGCLVGITVLLFPSEVKFSSRKFFFHISAQYQNLHVGFSASIF